MDILVISDSHGRDDKFEGLLSLPAQSPSAIFFLGDGLRDLSWIDTRGVPVYSVRGNCDATSFDAEDEILTEICGKRIFASHGHKYFVKSSYLQMAHRAACLGADIMLFGHTHAPLCTSVGAGESIGDITLSKRLHILNPGSLGYEGSFGNIVIRGGEILTSLGKL